MSNPALGIMRRELEKEIRWMETHRGYFSTPVCADHVIERLQQKIEWVFTMVNAKEAEAAQEAKKPQKPAPEYSWCPSCRRDHVVVPCSLSLLRRGSAKRIAELVADKCLPDEVPPYDEQLD